MKKFIAGVLIVLASVTAQAGVSSRPSVSASRSYSAPKSYSAPAVSAPSRSSTTTPSSNPGLKALGFSRPATTVTAPKPSVSVSPSRPAVQTSTVNTGWFGKKSVSSAPAYTAPVRRVSSPVSYRSVSSGPRTVVVSHNYYGGGYGYNRYYGGGYHPYGGYYGGMGSSFLYGATGAIGGMMLYNAMTTPHYANYTGGATASQIEQAKSNQRIEDKLDFQNQLLVQQQSQQTVATAPVAQPQCVMPQDAPLMMNPAFYCQQ